MTIEDLEGLKTIVRVSPVDRPAFYKDDFHPTQPAIEAARILRRYGYTVDFNSGTGRASIMENNAHQA